MRTGQDEYFMEITEAVAKRSPCCSRQVGCITIDYNNHILSTGYNGVPSGVEHCRQCKRTEQGRNLYSCLAVHAEQNALLQCSNVNNIVKIYVTINPCMICARLLANTSCHTIVFNDKYNESHYHEFHNFWVVRLKRNIVYLRGIHP